MGKTSSGAPGPLGTGDAHSPDSCRCKLRYKIASFGEPF